MPRRGVLLTAAVLVSVPGCGPRDGQLSELLRCPSPDGRFDAVFFGFSGGGAAGWARQRVAVLPRGEAITPTNFVFDMSHGLEARLSWLGPGELLVEYPETADVHASATRTRRDSVRVSYAARWSQHDAIVYSGSGCGPLGAAEGTTVRPSTTLRSGDIGQWRQLA